MLGFGGYLYSLHFQSKMEPLKMYFLLKMGMFH